MKISIARALTEIKTLDNRIQSKINSGVFVASVKKSSAKVNNVYTREEFGVQAKANYESITDLIERRRLIKSAVVKSNAETTVTIGEVTYTVADAIERKKNLHFEKSFLEILERQYRNAIANTNSNNEKVDVNLDRLLSASLGSDSVKKEDTSVFSQAYKDANYYEVLDVLNLKDGIEKVKTELLKFDSEFNIVLTESNAITLVEIPE
jgi:hypothetical protein